MNEENTGIQLESVNKQPAVVSLLNPLCDVCGGSTAPTEKRPSRGKTRSKKSPFCADNVGVLNVMRFYYSNAGKKRGSSSISLSRAVKRDKVDAVVEKKCSSEKIIPSRHIHHTSHPTTSSTCERGQVLNTNSTSVQNTNNLTTECATAWSAGPK